MTATDASGSQGLIAIVMRIDQRIEEVHRYLLEEDDDEEEELG